MARKETYISKQAKRLSAGQIDRRRFVMSALATGVTLPTAMSLASRAEAAMPRPGGHLRVGLASGAGTDTLNPMRADNQMTAAINLARGSTLTELAPEGRVKGDLASEFDVSPDGRAWHFKVAKGATFHDGRPVRADDVSATLGYHQRYGKDTATAGLVSQIADIATDGPDGITLRLARANWGFAHVLADHRLIILPSVDGDVDPETAVGSGPYRLDSFRPGEQAELVRHVDHRSCGTGHFDRITLFTIADPTARQSAILNKDVDLIDQVDPRAIGLLQKMPGVQVHEARGTRHVTLSVVAPDRFADAAGVIEAIRHLLPRQELLDRVLLGHGALGHDIPVQDETRNVTGTLDPEKARWLLGKLGLSGPFSLGVEPPVGGMADIAHLIAARVSEAGLTLQTVERSAPHALRISSEPGRATNDWLFATSYMPDAGCCETGWNRTKAGSEFGSAIRTARAIRDPNRSRDEFGRTARMLAKTGASLVPLFVNDVHAHSESLTWTVGDHVQSQATAARIARHGWFKKT